MKELNNAILPFDDWSHPWTFYEKVCSDKSLKMEDLKLFEEIWLCANDFKLWNYELINTGSIKATIFFKDKYRLTNNAIENIIKAIAYNWK